MQNVPVNQLLEDRKYYNTIHQSTKLEYKS